MFADQLWSAKSYATSNHTDRARDQADSAASLTSNPDVKANPAKEGKPNVLAALSKPLARKTRGISAKRVAC